MNIYIIIVNKSNLYFNFIFSGSVNSVGGFSSPFIFITSKYIKYTNIVINIACVYKSVVFICKFI